MLNQAPENINTIEGDLFWDATIPAAKEIARSKNIGLQNILKLGITKTSTGEYLDLKGSENGLTRKYAISTIQTIKFTGVAGTQIQKGKIVSTPATDTQESIGFSIVETKSIGTDGTVEINAECLTAGTIGNVAVGNITILVTSINGVKSVSNVKIFKYGVDIENDDDFRERIIQKSQTPATSGNKYHYLNWALEVTGVGAAKVFPLANGPGTVKVVIVDSNKNKASDELVKDTFNHIEEVRPIGANVSVVSAVEKSIDITANVTIVNGLNLGMIQTEFINSVVEYLQSVAFKASSISYAKIGSILLNTTGVLDYTDFKINNSTFNISLADEEIAVIGKTALGVI
ncbi:baseplate J/gp47 family protein [Clostridium saccharobutylicum]|nr:baseplate J/gp47 family protein [Clostridium saccharobutylicum]MBC2414575.1 baseplate J/gp47 family protein [Clostridium saccharobutylicum]MBC2437155.1 baseplate J/gp47 family protein [Clostridium saccharobutylicum]MBC2442325.1 baseplate J/gp47 family protein [Clostridium saccharobutylicum]MBC2446725.1 baseplate J/gp47 family protein [Clostridium saccharobutylicum]